MRLLLAGDHIPLADKPMANLTRQGYAVDWLADDRDAAVQGTSEPYGLIILDLGLPGHPGLKILQEWHGLGLTTPVLTLTTHGSWAKRTDGLKAGADGYLTEPFHLEELTLHTQALLRHAYGLANQSQLETAGLRLNEQRQYVYLNGVNVDPTAVEFRLPRYFMSHPGRVLSKGHLAEHLYNGETERDSNVIEVHANHLRRKLDRKVTETRRGQGYRYAGVVVG